MKELLLILVSSAIVNNVVLSQFLGLCPFFGVSKRIETAAGMGGAIIFVITLSSFVTGLIYNFILVPTTIWNIYRRSYLFLSSQHLFSLLRCSSRKAWPALYQCTRCIPSTDHNKLCSSWCCPDKRTERLQHPSEGTVNGFATAVGFTDFYRPAGWYQRKD